MSLKADQMAHPNAQLGTASTARSGFGGISFVTSPALQVQTRESFASGTDESAQQSSDSGT
jgi:hypothetical protein